MRKASIFTQNVDMTRGAVLKQMMLFALPLIFIVAGYIIYLKKYKIDRDFYNRIVNDLEERGELKEE